MNINSAKIRGQAFIIFTDPKAVNVALRQAQGEVFFGKELKLSVANHESKKIEELLKN